MQAKESTVFLSDSGDDVTAAEPQDRGCEAGLSHARSGEDRASPHHASDAGFVEHAHREADLRQAAEPHVPLEPDTTFEPEKAEKA